MATPIIVGGEQIATVHLGQFFYDDEEPDREVFRGQAREFGFDEAAYLAALDRVPRWSREKVDAAMSVYARLAQILSDLGHLNLMLEEAVDRVALQNAQMGLAQEIANLGYWHHDVLASERQWSENMYSIFARDRGLGPPRFDELPELVTPADAGLFGMTLGAAARGEPIDVTVRVPLPEGTTRYVHSRARPQYGADGAVVGVFGTSQDVTEERQRQETIERDLAVNQALSALYAALVARDVTIAEIADVVLEQALRLTDSPHGFVSEIDPRTGENIGHTLTTMMGKGCGVRGPGRRVAFTPGPDGRFRGLFGISLNERVPLIANDPGSHPLSVGTPRGHIPLDRFASVPVMLGDELVGQIAVANAPRDYDRHDVEVLVRLAEGYALAIRHNRVAERERAHLSAVESGARLATALVAATDEAEVWRLASGAVHELLPDARVVAVSVHESGEYLRIVDSRGFSSHLQRLTTLLGEEPKALRFPVALLTDGQLDDLTSGRLTTVEGGLPSLDMGSVSRTVLEKAARLLKADVIQVLGCATDGRLTGALVLMLPSEQSLQGHRDVVEMLVHQAEVALHRVGATAALRTSEWGLARAQKVGRVGSWVWDPVADRLSWSDEMYEIFGVPHDFALGFAAIEALIHPDDRERNTAAVGRMLGGADEVEYELRLVHPDGDVRTVLQRVEVERDESGAPRKLFGIVQDVTDLKRSEDEVRRSAERLRRALEATADAMGTLVETRDPYTAGHERRVAALAEAVARRLKLGEEAVTGVRVAGSMHDIGKISVPAEILSKPARLTDMEMELVKRHAEIGYDILRSIDFEWPIAEIVHQHHERLDGSGYPRGLSGDEICREARILAVADVVEAMSSHRPYRPALGLDSALDEIRSGRGVAYDADVVDACLAVLEQDGFTFPD
jgi:PAS domain S-box-containing protein/putative nucleotidyltransferase with HDIG domain